MAKTITKNNKTINTSSYGIFAAILFLFLGRLAATSNGNILFYQAPSEIATGLSNILSWLFLIFAIWFFLERKDLNLRKIIKVTSLMLAGFTFCLGLILTSTEAVGMIHSDGFSVTGGILMFLSGLFIGYEAKNGKKR